MPKLHVIVLASAAALLGLPAQSAQAQPRPPHRPHKRPPIAVIAKAVGLNAQQVAQIKKISYAMAKKGIGLKAKLQLAHLELKEAMSADKPPSEAKVVGLVGKIGRLETELKKLHLLRLLRVRKTMSLAKWRKLEAFHARHKPPRPPRPPMRRGF